VSMMEAARRARGVKQAASQPVVDTTCEDGERFVMSISTNEIVVVKDDGEIWRPYRIQKLSSLGPITLRPHTYAGPLKNSDTHPNILRKSPNTLVDITKKIQVDPLGRIFPAND
jgi:hypothetical protein